jgi:hypothetical protein
VTTEKAGGRNAVPTKQQQGSCAATTSTAASEMLVLNLSTQSGLNLTRHSEQPATADVEEDEDPMDYMMGLDLAVNGHGFEATIGRIEFSRLLFNQNKW